MRTKEGLFKLKSIKIFQNLMLEDLLHLSYDAPRTNLVVLFGDRIFGSFDFTFRASLIGSCAHTMEVFVGFRSNL